MADPQGGAVLRLRAQDGRQAAPASYTAANIRGMDFRDRNLAGADFRGAQAGVRKRWLAGYLGGAFLLALVAGLIIGGAATAPAVAAIAVPGSANVWQQAAMPVLGLLTVALLIALLFRHGLASSAGGLAALAAAAVLLMSLAGVDLDFTGRFVLLELGFGGLLGGAVLLSITLAAVRSLAGKAWLLLLAGSLLAAIPANYETIVGSRHAAALEPYLVARLVTGAAIAALFIGIAAYLAQRSMAGDSRFGAIRAAVVGLVSWKSTSFRRADLTGADFAGAGLGFADLRDAILVRTNWQDARELDRAYVAGTYLADDQLCRLAVTKQGGGRDFDGRDLEGFNLESANLVGASFVGANLSRATLHAANLTDARLAHTQLYDTNLSGATLTGAYIEHWGISSKTSFAGVKCAFVYMHLPGPGDPDPMRKPDDNRDFFAEGDFEYFIAPIIGTLEYYHRRNSDPRAVGRVAKTLDLVQQKEAGGLIEPQISALALQILAQRHPDADLEVISLRGKEGDKVQIRTLVADEAQRSRMSEEFHAIYAAILGLPAPDRMLLLDNLVARDQRNRRLGSLVLAATQDELSYAATSIRPAGRVTCLLFAANPLETGYLRLDEEQRAITKMLRASEFRNVFQLVTVPAARPDDLLQALNEYRPKVVQFSGHGDGAGRLLFVDDTGHAAPIGTTALRAVFSALKDDIRLVILNACYSAEQAGAIAESVDCVVGMSDAFSDDAAIAFVAAFYRALGFGRSLQSAFDQAIAAVGLQGQDERTIPIILTRAGVDPAQIILVAPDLLAASLPG